MSFRISKTLKSQYLKMMVYGPFGIGKTTFAASANTVDGMKEILYIDSEAGTLTIADKNIDIITINSFTQFSQIYEFLKRYCSLRDNDKQKELNDLYHKVTGIENSENAPLYNTVVIDSLSEVQKLVMYDIIGIDVQRPVLYTDLPAPEWKQWGQNAEAIRLLIRAFRDLPMNVIFVFSELEVENEHRQQLKKPALPGKLANEVQGFVDCVGYLSFARTAEGELIRRLNIEPSPFFQAKNRFNAKVKYFDNPTMQDIWDISMKGIKS